METPSRAQDDDRINQTLLRLNAAATGLGLGLLSGVGVLITTLWLALAGAETPPDALTQLLPGYSISLAGAVVGFAYAFVVGSVAGYVLARLYNRLAR